ncbi:daxx-like protein [Danaus plexippus]|uniref:daxx-like protein n=1 Tax=Danaus plexippus TaxID=13037 RepID=UPI002AB1FC98|nr:daxx-like protein [Danaus plexippus]
MASEDVIELGSSDDEAEPAPKKRKPMPNAMVVIPNKFPGLTIKPSHSNQFRKQKDILNKPIIFNKLVSNVNSNVHRKKVVTGSLQSPLKNYTTTKIVKTAIPIQNKFLNPLSIAKNLFNNQVSIPKPQTRGLKKQTEAKGSSLLNNLPPGITIKLVQNSCPLVNQDKIRTSQSTVGEVLTVEIDDEETSETSTSSPQWYIRPEDQVDENEKKIEDNNELKVETSIQEQNNKEPDKSKYVEITIEDSPLKPLTQKQDSEIGKELAITIEDSPAKPTPYKSNNGDGDFENRNIKEPHSKKKLDYPKENNDERQVVEIEIDLNDTSYSEIKENDDSTEKCQQIDTRNETQKCKGIDTPPVGNKSECNEAKTNNSENSIESKVSTEISDTEFHPVYQNFIDICFELENSDDMKKIVDKKIKAYYKQCPKVYVESTDFIDMVSTKIVLMKASPEKMYLYIKDVVDELNLQRKMAKSACTTEDTQQDPANTLPAESERDSKKMIQIRKLEKTIKKLHRAIQKLEQQEVDFDDDEDSVYLLTERYKERMVRVHKKFCQLTNTKMPSEPRIHIESRPGRPTGPAKRVEKWINKKVPIGAPLPFPDFHDVLHCVRDANDDDRLGWNEYEIMEEARDLFTRCGKKLQRRRQENEWRLAVSRITQVLDPAEENIDLKKRLEENEALATSKELELFKKFVDKQNQLKLEAVEIGDKEAEESPLESDDEEEVVESKHSAEEKQKRKEKIKELLQDKGKKTLEAENYVDSIKEKDNTGVESAEKQDGVDGNEDKHMTGTNLESKEQYETKNEDGNSEVIDENIDKIEQVDGGSESDKVESDVDELHLYQESRKCHDDEANSSALESSDSEIPIAISDTSESEIEMENDKKMSDIISIEDSSYSESESTYDRFACTKNDYILGNVYGEFEYSCMGGVESKQDEVVLDEDVVLESSDEESNKDVASGIGDTCINLKDDNISISETIVDGESMEQDISINEINGTFDNNNELKACVANATSSERELIIQECSEKVGSEVLNRVHAKEFPESAEMKNVPDENSIVRMETGVNEDKGQFQNCSTLATQEVVGSHCEKISETVQPIS